MSSSDTAVAVEADIVEGPDTLEFGASSADIQRDGLDDWVTIAEAAKRLGLSPDRVRRRLKAGEFQARQVASRYGPTWEIRLRDLTQRDSSSPGAAPTAAPRVAAAPGVTPSLAKDEETNDEGPAAVELVRLVRHQQDQLTQLAGQVGFLQAQLQQAQETLRLLQAPLDEAVSDEAETKTEESGQTVVMAEEMGRLKAELEQARQRVAEFEAVTAQLEREQEVAAAEAARRPWWRFWG
jgi:hypothetical protein